MPSIGAPEIILIILVIVLLFGAKKLPELARGSGRALRIFKAETKGLVSDDDDDVTKDPHGRPLPPGTAEAAPPAAPRPEPTREPVQDRTPRDQV
jgi:sec-independent protein translocase protein TatA